MQEQVIGIGHNRPPLDPNPAPWLAGAHALIRRRKRPTETAGRAHATDWILSFERRTPPEIDELMGWTGGDDPLATEVQLTFATRAEAVAYAERQGLDYKVEPEPERVTEVRLVPPWQWNRRPAPFGRGLGAAVRSAAGHACSAAERAQLPDLERALINPAAVFSRPADVLGHPRLMNGCKREILQRWAWDEYLKEVAASEGMAEGEPSRLDEVKAALLSLGETWRPKPFAPAAAVPLLQQEMELVAA
ncbi:NADH dehydrogenase ubiquinone Fe-S protein 4 [Methylobacterium nigriterrae]|uniref:NADH dehydrogenase ubiquinone Fe-S protein 4 n=1 Tax=Methylobacterium nigriterrae TaxID=3127512 RepID=UPI0030140356